MADVKAHTRYKNLAGKVVPSVTTVIGNLGWNTRALMIWATNQALAGIDPEKAKNEAADKGTLAHALIEQYIRTKAGLPLEEAVDLSKYSEDHRTAAHSAFNAFIDWTARVRADLSSDKIVSEFKFVSEFYGYGGTIDAVLPLDGVLSLVDFKTSNGIYANHLIQVAAYQAAWKELKGETLPVHILRLSKDDGSFHHHEFGTDLNEEFVVFQHLLEIHRRKYKIESRVGKGGEG